jgi:hypothetical protein
MTMLAVAAAMATVFDISLLLTQKKILTECLLFRMLLDCRKKDRAWSARSGLLSVSATQAAAADVID